MIKDTDTSGSLKQRSRNKHGGNGALQGQVIVSKPWRKAGSCNWARRQNVINFQAIMLNWFWAINAQYWFAQPLGSFPIHGRIPLLTGESRQLVSCPRRRLTHTWRSTETSPASDNLEHVCLPLLHGLRCHTAQTTSKWWRSSRMCFSHFWNVLTSPWAKKMAAGLFDLVPLSWWEGHLSWSHPAPPPEPPPSHLRCDRSFSAVRCCSTSTDLGLGVCSCGWEALPPFIPSFS